MHVSAGVLARNGVGREAPYCELGRPAFWGSATRDLLAEAADVLRGAAVARTFAICV